MTLAELPYSAADLFPSGDFGFHMRFRRGDIAQFYQNTRHHAEIVAERQKWVRADPQKYVAALPEAEPLLEEAVEVAGSVGVAVEVGETPAPTMRSMAEGWEPDLLLLKAPSATSQPLLLAGAVCFPSSWALEEKMGRPLDAIHAAVPTLNEQFASPVQQFLARIKPGISWERVNWGLSRSPELNQHPSRKLPRLDNNVRLDEVWFRAEYQSLIALPRNGGVLFGIRLAIEPLATLCRDERFREGVEAAVRTMPDAIAVYKGIAAARGRLLELLSKPIPGAP